MTSRICATALRVIATARTQGELRAAQGDAEDAYLSGPLDDPWRPLPREIAAVRSAAKARTYELAAEARQRKRIKASRR